MYSATPKTFSHPEWMPKCPQPSVPMTTAPFTEEEVRGVISGLKSSSAPSPADQIPYTIIKRCPSLLPTLLHMYNCCWTTQAIPTAWKVGIVHLLGKKKAADDSTKPSHFHPIVLTSCISKVFISLVKRRLLSFMVSNNFLNTATQKTGYLAVQSTTSNSLPSFGRLRGDASPSVSAGWTWPTRLVVFIMTLSHSLWPTTTLLRR